MIKLKRIIMRGIKSNVDKFVYNGIILITSLYRKTRIFIIFVLFLKKAFDY